MELSGRIVGLWTNCFLLFILPHLTLSDSPNHQHSNPKIVYVSPFASETRNQKHPSASARQANSYASGRDYQLPDTSDYGAHPLPVLKPHDYSNAIVVEDPKYTSPETPLEVYVEPAPDVYIEPAQDTYAQPIQDGYDSPLEEYVPEPPVEPQSAPAPSLGLLQLLPLFVITVLAVIASTIVGALLG